MTQRPFAALLLLAPLLLAPAQLPASPDTLVTPGRNVLELDLRVDAEGRALLAWVEQESAASHPLFVQRLEPEGWRRLGGALNIDPGTAAQGVFVRPTPDGGIWAAFSENGGHADIVQFRRWDGAGWGWRAPMRQSIDLTYAARSRDLELEPDGTPLWAWAEITQTGIKVQTRRWSGRAWQKSEPLSLDPRALAVQPALDVDPQGRRAVVWLEGDVARSSVWVVVSNAGGAGWTRLDGPLNVRPRTFSFAPTVKLDAQGHPLVAWLEDRAGVDTLFVKRWNGQRWLPLGDALNSDPRQFAERPALALNAGGQPCVAWAEGDEARKRVFTRCWSGSAWQLRSSTPAPLDARSPALASGGGTLHLAWRERSGTLYRLRHRTL